MTNKNLYYRLQKLREREWRTRRLRKTKNMYMMRGNYKKEKRTQKKEERVKCSYRMMGAYSDFGTASSNNYKQTPA